MSEENQNADAVAENKAYDFAELGRKLKESGLEVAEEAVEKMLGAVFTWIEDSAKNSANAYDDVIVSFLPKLKEFVFGQAEKIDGKVDAPEAPKVEG